MNSKKTYRIGPTQTLVDINGELVNFVSEWNVTGNQSFQIKVVTQEDLDSETPIEFIDAMDAGDVKGISGNVKNDKNQPKSYYLILKADSPVDVTVELKTEEVEPNLEISEQQVSQDQASESTSSTRWVLIIVGLLVLSAGIYFFFSSKKEDSEPEVKSSPTKVKVEAPSVPVVKPIKSYKPFTPTNFKVTKKDSFRNKLMNFTDF